MDEKEIRRKYADVTKALIGLNRSIATMESCTSGTVASLISDTEGASAIFKGGLITYCNEAKNRYGVAEEVIDRYGVYSVETAEAMAEACRKAFSADLGIGVTGSFRNADPANADSVPGEVCYAIAGSGCSDSGRFSVPFSLTRPEAKLYAAGVIADKLVGMVRG